MLLAQLTSNMLGKPGHGLEKSNIKLFPGTQIGKIFSFEDVIEYCDRNFVSNILKSGCRKECFAGEGGPEEGGGEAGGGGVLPRRGVVPRCPDSSVEQGWGWMATH